MLTPADLIRGVESGKYAAEARRSQQRPTSEEAKTRATEAFNDGLYFVFVDDVQVEDLETELDLSVTSRLRLVRLVALAGG